MAITISGENNNDRILASDGVIDQISGINIVGLITASHINVGSNIQLGNAGIITATTFVGNVTGNVNSTSPLLLQTGGSERFRITGNNELGIAGANYGSSGQVLTSGGSGSAVSWTTIPTQVTIANNADNRVITGGSGTNLNGESTLNYGSGHQLIFSGSATPLSGTSLPYSVNIYRDGGSGYGYFDTMTNSSYSTGVRIRTYNNTTYNNVIEHTTSKVTNFQTNGLTRLSIASNGDIGLGTVPETDSFQPSLYFAGGNANIWGSSNSNLYTAVNVRYTGGGGWKYNNNGLASYTAQQSGTWEFRNAPSGTADNVATFTTRLQIATDGDVTITGSDNAELKLKCGTSTGNNIIAFLNSSGTTKGNIFYDSDNNFMVFKTNGTASSNERLRINSSGFIGMGGNTNPTNVLHIKTAVTNTAVATIESTATNSYPFLRLKNDAREYQITCHGGLADAFTIYDGTSSAHRFTIGSNGQVRAGDECTSDRTSYRHQFSSTAGSGDVLSIQNPSNTDGQGIGLGFWARNTNNAAIEVGKIKAVAEETQANSTQKGSLRFLTNKDASLVESMRLNSSGNVTIYGRTHSSSGTSSSNVPLQIVGSGNNNITMFLGNGSTSGNGANDYSADIRFNGAGVAWGDISYYPTGNYNGGSFRFTGNGSSVASQGNRSLGCSGIFISGTAQAQHLDDYEEGSWTPTYYAMSSAIPITHDLQAGSYVKIGRVVYWQFRIRVSNITGNRNQGLSIAGFPHTVDNSQPQCSGNFYAETWDGEMPTTIFYNGNTTRGQLYYYADAMKYYSTSMLDMNVNSSYLVGSGFYFAA